MSLCKVVSLLLLGSVICNEGRTTSQAAILVPYTTTPYYKDVEEIPTASTTTSAPPEPTTEDPKGSYTIVAKGSVEWKETITVSKKKGAIQEEKTAKQRQRTEHHSGFIPKCCNAPSNKSQEKDFITRRQKCEILVKNVLGNEVNSKVYSKSDSASMNCFLQCTSRRAGLCDENGAIKSKEMVDYMAADIKMAILGINKEMINACIITSKGNPEIVKTSSEGADVCNLANHEHLHFVKCMLKMENNRCPEKYQVQSSVCDKYREKMK